MIYKGINFPYEGTQQSGFNVWLNWDDEDGTPLYLSERFLVLVHHADGNDPLPVIVEYGIGLPPTDPRRMKIIYQVDDSGYVIIDLTDWVRTYYKTDDLRKCVVVGYDGQVLDGDQMLLDIHSQFYLINPNTIPVPKSTIEYLRITPPSRMLQSDAITIMAQSFIWQDAGAPSRQWRYRPIGGSTFTNLSNGDTFYIEQSGVEISSNGGEKGTFEPAPTECGVRYAMIKWRSLVGPYKIHNFVIKSQNTETQDDYSLLMVDNSYNVIKGSEESLIFSIDELNTYDLWYYSDILTSSEVSLLAHDGKFIGSVSQGQFVGGIRLEITTKNVTIPSGDRADGKLEFEAKIKRYDAVTL